MLVNLQLDNKYFFTNNLNFELLLFQILLDFDRKFHLYVSHENSRFKNIKVGDRFIINWAVEASKIVTHANKILDASNNQTRQRKSRSRKPKCEKSKTLPTENIAAVQDEDFNVIHDENIDTVNIETNIDEVKRSDTQYSNLEDILTKNKHLQTNG